MINKKSSKTLIEGIEINGRQDQELRNKVKTVFNFQNFNNVKMTNY